MKPPTFAPAYVGLFPVLSEIAQRHGYALAVHGSVVQDFDLIAVPWVVSCSSAEVLMRAVAAQVQASMGITNGVGVTLETAEKKPHGRLAWSIPIDSGAVIDLSVMPKQNGTGAKILPA